MTLTRGAIYTGGGIYIYYGSLEDGTYFMFDNVCPAVTILNVPFDPDNDECWFAEWQDANAFGCYEEGQAYDFILGVLHEILLDGCNEDSNYQRFDIIDDITYFEEMRCSEC